MDNQNHFKGNEYIITPNATVETMYEKFAQNYFWYLFLGIGLVILGIIALAAGVYGTVFTTLFLGAVMASAGILEIIEAFKMKGWAVFFLHLFLGILYSVSGVFIIFNPLLNAIFLTLFLSIFFIISGIFRVAYALTTRMPNHTWLLFSGILNVILGYLIYKQWPYSGLWVLGAFLGIDLIVSGWSWIFLALKSKKTISIKK